MLVALLGLTACHDDHHHNNNCEVNCGDNGDGGNDDGGNDDGGNDDGGNDDGGNDDGGNDDGGNDDGGNDDGGNGDGGNDGGGNGDGGNDGGDDEDDCDEEDDNCPVQPNIASDILLTVDGVVLDGYMADASVCIDLDQDYKCGNNEPVTRTDNDGKFKFENSVKATDLEGTPYVCLASGNCGDHNAVRLLAFSDAMSKNVILGYEYPLTTDVALTSLAFLDSVDVSNNISTAKFESVVISPYSTLAALTFGGSDSTASTISQQQFNESLSEVAGAMLVDPKTAGSDYNNRKKLTDRTTKALITGEVMVRSGLMPNSISDLEARSYLPVTSEELSQMAESIWADVKNVEKDAQTRGGKARDIAEALEDYSINSLGNMESIAGRNAADFRCGINRKNVYCWGNNAGGVLGDPAVYPLNGDGAYVSDGATVKDNYRSKPVVVKLKNGTRLSGVKSVDTGLNHACALTYSGDVYCWGNNKYGQIGNGETSAMPVLYAEKVIKKQTSKKTTYLTNAESISLTRNSSCAVVRNDSDPTISDAYCWGDNTVMQMGNAYPDQEVLVGSGMKSLEGIALDDFLKAVPTPVKVKFPNTVKSVNHLESGMWSVCAFVENEDAKNQHNLYCWGDDTRGLVSQNWYQYRDDFIKNYAGVLKLKDQSDFADNEKGKEGTKNWMWRIYDESLDWHPIYGAPVTAITATGRSADDQFLVNVNGVDIDRASVPKNMCDISLWFGMNKTFAKNIKSKIKAQIENSWIGDEHTYQKLNGKCNAKSQTACSVSKVIKEYKDANGYSKNVIAVCSRDSKDWTETVLFESSNFDANTENLNYITVVTSVDSIKTTQLELNNVTNLSIGNFDSTLNFELNNDSRIWSTYNRGESTDYWISHNLSNSGETLKKLVFSVDDSVGFVLSNQGNVYGLQLMTEYNNNEVFGMKGTGNAETAYPYTPLLNEHTPLQQVDDLSLNLHSVCADSLVSDDKGDPTSQKVLYCWGSSIFGQQGFDNLDGGFSAYEVENDWNGYDKDNRYMKKTTRIELSPKQIELNSDSAGE